MLIEGQPSLLITEKCLPVSPRNDKPSREDVLLKPWVWAVLVSDLDLWSTVQDLEELDLEHRRSGRCFLAVTVETTLRELGLLHSSGACHRGVPAASEPARAQ